MMRVTDHALSRYAERVEPVGRDRALTVIQHAAYAVDTAADFGCDCVVLGNGARLMLQGDVVVTVLPKRYGRRSRWQA